MAAASKGPSYMSESVIKEHLYKILVIGEFGVGFFSPNYKLTIGVDFALKTIEWDSNTQVNIQLWDIAGHERFGHMTRVYYKYAIAAIIVFDLSRPATFDSVLKWLEDVHSKVMLANEEPIPVLLLANKCDIENIEISTEVLAKFCKLHNFIGWFPTSAKTDLNIEESMKYLVEHILMLATASNKAGEHIALQSTSIEGFDDTILEEMPTDDKNKCCTIL